MRRFIRGCMSMRGMWYRESPSYPRRISFILSRISPSQPTYSNQSQILVPSLDSIPCLRPSCRYVAVVKVGKPTETSKPGNRGKRYSQVLLLQYLNRVHFDAPMSPLELEIYHQMRNVIGIDPTFYEYIFQVDADTARQARGKLCPC